MRSCPGAGSIYSSHAIKTGWKYGGLTWTPLVVPLLTAVLATQCCFYMYVILATRVILLLTFALAMPSEPVLHY